MSQHTMNHELAETTGAVDRYLLNELNAKERAEFEAHYFDCTICADQVRSGAIFIDTAKQVMRDEQPEPELRAAARGKWFDWLKDFLRPAVLTPSFATLALAALVGYQNLVTFPALEKPQVLSMMVIAPQAREQAPVVKVDPALPQFNVNFLVDSPRVYPAYLCQFTRANGEKVLQLDSGPRNVSSFTLSFLLPARQFPDGTYQMTMHPLQEPLSMVERYTFVVRRNGSQ